MNDPIIPGSVSTAASETEKTRAKWRAKKAAQRAAEKATKLAAGYASQNEWWEGNRAALRAKEGPPKTLVPRPRTKLTELEAMEKQDQYIEDLLDSMELAGEAVPPEWQGQIDFISVEETVKQVIESVKEHGVLHFTAIMKDPSIPPDWSVKPYWQDPELLERLCAENWQMEQHARYGYLAALPDSQVEEFLQKKAGWSWQQVANLLGIVIEEGRCRYV